MPMLGKIFQSGLHKENPIQFPPEIFLVIQESCQKFELSSVVWLQSEKCEHFMNVIQNKEV